MVLSSISNIINHSRQTRRAWCGPRTVQAGGVWERVNLQIPELLVLSDPRS